MDDEILEDLRKVKEKLYIERDSPPQDPPAKIRDISIVITKVEESILWRLEYLTSIIDTKET